MPLVEWSAGWLPESIAGHLDFEPQAPDEGDSEGQAEDGADEPTTDQGGPSATEEGGSGDGRVEPGH
jgi:hypothetical protein